MWEYGRIHIHLRSQSWSTLLSCIKVSHLFFKKKKKKVVDQLLSGPFKPTKQRIIQSTEKGIIIISCLLICDSIRYIKLKKIYKIQINIYLILTKYQLININFWFFDILKFCLKIFKNWDIDTRGMTTMHHHYWLLNYFYFFFQKFHYLQIELYPIVF